jgi:hypothetical protein
MIADKSPGWGAQLGAAVRANDYNAEKSLNAMGLLIKDQLQESIRSLKDPPNAPSTIKRKGFDSPLIDTGTMLNSVDYEVT